MKEFIIISEEQIVFVGKNHIVINERAKEVFDEMIKKIEQIKNVKRFSCSKEGAPEFMVFRKRIINCLRFEDILNSEQLIQESANDLLKIRSFGKVCLKEVRDTLAKHGLKLKGD